MRKVEGEACMEVAQSQRHSTGCYDHGRGNVSPLAQVSDLCPCNNVLLVPRYLADVNQLSGVPSTILSMLSRSRGLCHPCSQQHHVRIPQCMIHPDDIWCHQCHMHFLVLMPLSCCQQRHTCTPQSRKSSRCHLLKECLAAGMGASGRVLHLLFRGRFASTVAAAILVRLILHLLCKQNMALLTLLELLYYSNDIPGIASALP